MIVKFSGEWFFLVVKSHCMKWYRRTVTFESLFSFIGYEDDVFPENVYTLVNTVFDGQSFCRF